MSAPNTNSVTSLKKAASTWWVWFAGALLLTPFVYWSDRPNHSPQPARAEHSMSGQPVRVQTTVFEPQANPTPAPVITTRAIEEQFCKVLQPRLDQAKQTVFDKLHPLGTAKKLLLHDATITAWKRGEATNRLEDIQQITIRYTLYWEGPITKDGFTKVNEVWDVESQRWVSTQIVATNGVTNSEAGEIAGSIAAQVLINALANAGN